MPKRVSQSKKKKPGPKAMPPKWLQVIDLMAIGGLAFQAAMEEAGYSPKYYKANGYRIQQDTRFSKCLKAKKASIKSKTEDRREKRLKYLDNLIEDPNTQPRDGIAATQVQGRMCGWLSETIRHESTERQAALDAVARDEVARLAALALNTRQLPDVTLAQQVTSKVVTSATVSQHVNHTMSHSPVYETTDSDMSSVTQGSDVTQPDSHDRSDTLGDTKDDNHA
ncbi:MAG: hypothetical protein GY941_21750 [Planctomycetes bacterium]|nr:hypothetical protein [Planctomycetota bacterium]